MVGDPEGDALAEGQCVTEMVWLALAEEEGQREDEGDTLGDGVGVGGALCVPETQGEGVTETLTRGEFDTEGVGVPHAEADALRLFEGEEVPLRVVEGQAEPLGEPLPVGAPLAVAPPVRDTEGLADTLLQGVLEAESEGEWHAEAEAVLVGQGVEVRDCEGLPEDVGHTVAVPRAVALTRGLADTEGEPELVAAAVALAESVPLPLTEVEREGEPVTDGQLVGLVDTVTLTVALGERVCVALTEGERVPRVEREGEPVTDTLLDADTVPDGEREEEPHGEALAHTVPVGGRGVADTEGLVDTLRVAPPVEDTEGLVDTLLLPLEVGGVLREALADTQPEEVVDTVALAVALGAALPLRLPLPLLDTLVQPELLTEDDTLPEGDPLLRMVRVTDTLVDAERDTL